MEAVSIEFWGILQVAIDLCLVGLFVIVIVQIRSSNRKRAASGGENAMGSIENVLKDAHDVARQFDMQLKEKQRIVKRINEGIDSKIIGLNLLLKRAETVLEIEMEKSQRQGQSRDICKLQEEIIALADKGMGTDLVATRLGISKAEVELVTSLKRKFEEMERN